MEKRSPQLLFWGTAKQVEVAKLEQELTGLPHITDK